MTHDEISALAADISENGQADPITLGKINGHVATWLVDGRNRLKACEVAGVEPVFETREFKDEDEIKAFVNSKSERRDLTRGQQAMRVALLYPEPTRLKRKGSSVAKEQKVSEARLSTARTVLAHSRELALAVRDGLKTLDDALDDVKASKKAMQSAEAMTERLRRDAPDLADLVTEERMKLSDGIAALDERIRLAEREQRTATDVLHTMTNALYPRLAPPDQWADRLIENVRLKFWPSSSEPPSAEYFKACADVLNAISQKWER
jgi:hypothetical protein